MDKVLDDISYLYSSSSSHRWSSFLDTFILPHSLRYLLLTISLSLYSTVSAPGKVLIVGGYLVLQEGIAGLVVSTSSRFHSTVYRSTTTPTKSSNPTVSNGTIPLIIESPQFRETWCYTLSTKLPYTLTPTSYKDNDRTTLKRNPYVEYTIETALCYLSSSLLTTSIPFQHQLDQLQSTDATLHILLQADNEFYSQRSHLLQRNLPISLTSLASLPSYLPFPDDPEHPGKVLVNKTGLGSSAALVTSLSGALLTYFKGIELLSSTSVFASHAVHTVAQIAHGLAQGKIGSGFDVCAATFGSIRFTRIPPTVLGLLMDKTEYALHGTVPSSSSSSSSSVTSPLETYKEIQDILVQLHIPPVESSVANDWKYTADPFVLPSGLSLMLADVAGGSETPGMVKKVLDWRKDQINTVITDNEELNAIQLGDLGKITDPEQLSAATMAYNHATGPIVWKLLAGSNARIAVIVEQLRILMQQSLSSYRETLRLCVQIPSSEWHTLKSRTDNIHIHKCIEKLFTLRDAFIISRTLIRTMGILAQVPIEPIEQTNLANKTLDVPGVLAAGVPGAGGYDALYAIILDPDDESFEEEATTTLSSEVLTGGTNLSAVLPNKNGIITINTVRQAVEQCWLNWPGGGLTPLLLKDGPGKGQKGAGILLESEI